MASEFRIPSQMATYSSGQQERSRNAIVGWCFQPRVGIHRPMQEKAQQKSLEIPEGPQREEFLMNEEAKIVELWKR